MSSEVLDAARRLRSSLHALADRLTTTELDAASLHAAADAVDATHEQLDGDPMPRWWEGPADATPDGLRTYRRRSLFQGELHPFSNALRWHDATGPEGQLGYGFRVTVPALFEGPPRAVHGGYLAGLFDELLGAVQGRAPGGSGYTGRLTIRYRSFTPIAEELTFAGWVVRDVGRRIETHGTCYVGDRLCSEAEALFVRPSDRS